MNRHDHGRSLLLQWETTKPANFYADDAYLRLALRRRLEPDGLARAEAVLSQAGADAAGPINRAAFELDRPERLPRLERWNRVGDRTEEVVFDPAYHEIGRLVWRSGILSVLGEPGHVTLHAALFYLFGLNGEVPHLCPVSCTAGLIKAIQRSGSDWMRQTWLPRLLDPDYARRWHGAQFLTEVVASLEDRLARAGTPPESDPLFRTAVNLNKYVCSVDAGLVVHHAMEILGGNGTIEDFSPLPRLYRDVPVQETWEGPHNTLMAQMLRDAARAKMHDALLGYAQDVLLGAGPAAFSKTRDRALAALEETRGRLAGLLRGDLADAALHIRVLMTRVARITQVALLLEDAQYAADDPGWAWLEAAAELILNRWVVPGWEPMDDPGYPALVGRVLGE